MKHAARCAIISLFIVMPAFAQTTFTVTAATSSRPEIWVEGGDPTGVADSLSAFVDAHTRCPLAGCEIVVPCGTFAISSNALLISKDKVTIRGLNQECSTIKRLSDVAGPIGPVLNITGTSIRIANLRIQEYGWPTPAANTSMLVQLINLNEAVLDNVWIQGGYYGIKISHVSNIAFQNVLVEAARHRGFWFLQTSDVTMNGVRGYSTGTGGTDAASIYIEKDPTYTAWPAGYTITGNFPFTLLSHHIYASQVEGLTITGSTFSQAGRHNANNWDAIKLVGVKGAQISSNAHLAGANPYQPGVIATRNVVNIDATSTGVVVGPNTFHAPGMTATVANSAADTIIVASDVATNQAPPVKAMALQSFCTEITNTLGTIQHRLIAECVGSPSTLGNYAGRIVGASGTLANTPTVGAGVDFTTGIGIGSGSNVVYFNTAAQVVGDQLFAPCTIERDTTASAFEMCDWRLETVNVNGVTRPRLALRLWDSNGAAVLISTGTIGASTVVRAKFHGYLY